MEQSPEVFAEQLAGVILSLQCGQASLHLADFAGCVAILLACWASLCNAFLLGILLKLVECIILAFGELLGGLSLAFALCLSEVCLVLVLALVVGLLQAHGLAVVAESLCVLEVLVCFVLCCASLVRRFAVFLGVALALVVLAADVFLLAIDTVRHSGLLGAVGVHFGTDEVNLSGPLL